MAWSMARPNSLVIEIAAAMSFAIACISGCFAAFATALRFGGRRTRILRSASANAFGIYALHYPFVVWMQYALLGLGLFAIAKGFVVFAVALLCSWALSVAFRTIRWTAMLIGGERRAFAQASVSRIDRDRDGHPEAQLSRMAR
jgi:hypothetical protein